jgi:hypothetical protein
MAEKVIHEVRFIETDDGFRIEVKGDKERLKEMGFGPGMMGFGHGMGFGPRMIFKRHRHGRHGHGHRRRRRFGPGFGPWAWWNDWFEQSDEDETEEMPPKDA